MVDLSNWDFAPTFSGIQAALLILGIDPTNAGQDDRKIVPVIQRMKTDYKGALGAAVWARDLQDSPKGNLPDPMQGPKNLYSLKMFDPQGYEYNLDRLKEGHWLSDEEATKFDNQQFPRNEIARWLGATGMSSVYKFGVESKHDRPAGPRWPWGDHHTNVWFTLRRQRGNSGATTTLKTPKGLHQKMKLSQLGLWSEEYQIRWLQQWQQSSDQMD